MHHSASPQINAISRADCRWYGRPKNHLESRHRQQAVAVTSFENFPDAGYLFVNSSNSETMAEAIALAGSIIAIVQVASAAVKLSQSLYTTARKAGSAKEDIENFAMDMNTFASIIRSTHRSIRRYCQEESRSPAIRYIKEHNILEQVVDQATRVGRKIEQVRPPIQDLRGRLSIVNRFRWSLVNRHDVKALNPQMECVKTNLHLVMDIMILEKLQQGYRSDETRQEM